MALCVPIIRTSFLIPKIGTNGPVSMSDGLAGKAMAGKTVVHDI